MKKTLLVLLFTTISIFAQTGILKSTEGVRVPSAVTLEQGNLSTTIGIETINDGEPLILQGTYTDVDGNKIDSSRSAPSATFTAFFAYGAHDNIEFGALLPILYDGAIGDEGLDGAGVGDAQFYVKGSLPLTLPVHLGASIELYAPTGNTEIGYRPRHVWYFQTKNPTKAYTSGSWSFATSIFASVDKFEFIHWNNYIGILKSLGNSNIALLWGSGLVFFPHKILTFSLELSGETRLASPGIPLKAIHDPLRLSPGLRLHLPNHTDLSVGLDLGLGFFQDLDNDDGLPVQRNVKNGSLDYQVVGSPKLGVSISLNKTFDFSWKDSDHDGVIDRTDLCPNSSLGVTVNQRGCPVDEDQDGVLNIVDDCPGTPSGVAIDYTGCPLDFDHDGVPDYLDACPETPEGQAIDKRGCLKDSDGDGIDDNADKCPNSIPGEGVDKEGCPLDEDHDGVLNEADNCPNTPKNIPVDQYGCPLDFDHDGIPDIWDNCPNSVEGEIIGKNGCPLDSDMDGVPDSKDQCANTPAETMVGIDGCPSDRDKDGVPDFMDKCPNTRPGVPVDSIGCNKDSDKDGIPDFMDKCPGTFPNIKVDGVGCPVDKKNSLDAIAQRIKFLNGTNELQDASYSALNDVILLMRKYKFKLTITCSQHAATPIAEYFELKGFKDKFDIQIKPGSPVRFQIAEE